MRFVPFDGSPLVSELGTCLRLIECREDTPVTMPMDLKQTAFTAWQQAREHIFDSWTFETDPANLQPKISRFNRELAEFIRQNPPKDIEQEQIQRCLDAIEAPCPVREQNLLRAVFEKGFPSNSAKARAIVDEVKRIGLEPFHAPEPLPPIDNSHVHLVCWMAVESQG
jgi:hypothetical protein